MDAFDDAYFRGLYGGAPKQTGFDRARDDRVVRLVRRYAPSRQPESALLEVGCGFGYLLGRFRRRYRLFGVEISTHAAARARARVPEAHIFQADVQGELPTNQGFDVVLAINIIEHLHDPRSAVEAFRSALVPGGLCVVHLPTINGRVSQLIYRYAYASDPTHIYRPSGSEVLDLFRSSGFEVLESSYAPHTPALLSGFGWHPAFLAAFRRA